MHIHVERQVVRAGADYRNVLSTTLGKAIDAPAEVTTGCGIRVPYATTSPHPERVTCLPCREHAQREHRAVADQLENLARMPGSPISPADAAKAAQRSRDLADRFG
ncbi:hypothetical protein [Actinophytocola sp. KF-1]